MCSEDESNMEIVESLELEIFGRISQTPLLPWEGQSSCSLHCPWTLKHENIFAYVLLSAMQTYQGPTSMVQTQPPCVDQRVGKLEFRYLGSCQVMTRLFY